MRSGMDPVIGKLALKPLVSLHWKRLDNDILLFDEASGQTFELNPVAASALLTIEQSPQSVQTLAAAVGVELALSEDDVRSVLPAIIDQLKDTGLVDMIDG